VNLPPMIDDVTGPLPSAAGDEREERPRVLVVDDDERNLLAIENVLEDVGEVVVARSGEEALRHLLKGEFAVILLDVYMPQMDGYETAQIIRSREQTKRIPIVFLSAVNKEAEHQLKGYAMGAVDYVFKPVDPIVLRSKVAVFVDLFAKTREIERKALAEQALLDENLRANEERLRALEALQQAETQLVQAQKMDAIGKLTGGIAHDFNNLLAAVIGGLGLLERRGSLGEEQQKIVTMTRRAAEQGSDLVGRLLAFARRQQLQPAAIEIARLADTVSDLLAHTLGGRVELDWTLAPGVAAAWADQAQLELALLNLIINARDAMPDGGTIRLAANTRSLARDDQGLEPGDYVVLAVSDTGCGISPDHLGQVLEPFFTTKEVGKGTGLGLSMVYGFAKQSGGAFRIASELGQGTTAEIWLPCASAQEAPVLDAPAEPAIDCPSLDILLVDDHADVRRTTAAMLEELGHRVVDAQGGQDALALLDVVERPCDLLVTDYAMPRLSGTDLVREARARRATLPALIITGYTDAEAIGERPADVAILAKPFTLEGLSRAVAAAAAAPSTRPKRVAAG